MSASSRLSRISARQRSDISRLGRFAYGVVVGSGRRIFGIALAILATGGAFTPPISGAAQPPTVLTCTNLVSGASWQIRINFEQGTVDSNPAQISSTEISWRDGAHGPYYTLDRKSGSLTVIFTSSTGGYALHDRCGPQS
jgi:hypothetical protein